MTTSCTRNLQISSTFWLKRTAGLLYPDLFTSHLTDKDREAVANAARFAGQKGGAKKLAGRDYQHRMAAIFDEQRRKLKPDAIMTVMFTHKAKDAWDALTAGLIGAALKSPLPGLFELNRKVVCTSREIRGTIHHLPGLPCA